MTSRVPYRLIGYLTVLALIPPSASRAQQLGPVSFEANIGLGLGRSSAPHGPSVRLVADALLAFRIPARVGASVVIGSSASVQSVGAHQSCDILPGGTCSPDFPEFQIVSALAGLETEGGSARILVGPAVAVSRSHAVGAGQARVEFARPLFARVSVTASGRFAYVPQHRGEAFSLGAMGVGLRLR